VKRCATVVTVFILGATCGCNSSRATTSPTTPTTTTTTTTATPTANATTISVGQEVSGTLKDHGAKDDYDLTASSSGTLVVQLNWSMAQGRLEFNFAGRFVSQDNSPIVARLPVEAGQKYRLTVGDAIPWDYDAFNLRYVMTTALE
jgi:hypothetical protein